MKLPNLVPISTVATDTLIIPLDLNPAQPTPSTSNLQENQNVIDSTDEADVKSRKRKMLKQKGKTKVRRVSNAKGDELTLSRMHKENMSVLQNIDRNFSRLADSVEKICEKANSSPNCPIL